jgi:hypothetical protein
MGKWLKRWKSLKWRKGLPHACAEHSSEGWQGAGCESAKTDRPSQPGSVICNANMDVAYWQGSSKSLNEEQRRFYVRGMKT